MTAHIFNRQWDQINPATLSPAVINGLLRGQLGYSGVVISDDLQMGAIRSEYSFEEAIRKVIEAGVDIIAIANNSVYDEQVMAKGVAVVKQLVDDQVITVERIDQSYQRLMQLKSRLNDR
jgi:beta-N-acetylhexosaminidase